MSESESRSLSTAWINAIVDARRVLPAESLRDVFNKTNLSFKTGLHTIASFEADIKVSTVVRSLPPIEQHEVMLYILAVRAAQLSVTGYQAGMFYSFGQQLGCLPFDTLTIAERWRKLAIIRDISELPYYGLESRPHCKICDGIVATGAGWTNEDVAPTDDRRYRADLHQECKNYALTVMAPAFKAARAAQAQLDAARIDK